MTDKKEITDAFNSIENDYDNYMEKSNHANAQKKIIELLKDEINGKVIDVATGTGTIAICIARKIPNISITAVDVSEKMIEKAKKNAELAGVDINFLVGDSEKLKISDKKFDIVICCLGLLWIIDKEAALKEMARICKINGKIILIEEEGETARARRPGDENLIFSEKMLSFFSKVEKLETSISLEEIERKVKKLGYNIVKKIKERIDEYHGFVGMVFEAKK